MNTHHVLLRQSTEEIDRENLFIIADKVRSEGRVEFFRASYIVFLFVIPFCLVSFHRKPCRSGLTTVEVEDDRTSDDDNSSPSLFI